MRKITVLLLLTFQLAGAALAKNAPLGELAQVLTGTNPPGSVAQETTLGAVTADAARKAEDCGAALIPGGLIVSNLQAGEVYADDLAALFSRDEPLAVAELSEAELRDWLEHSVSHIVVGEDERVDGEASAFDGFLQVSGLRLEYDPSAPPGARVFSLELEDGLTYPVRVCVTQSMAMGAMGYTPHAWEPGAHTLLTATEAYFSGASVTAPKMGRCVCVGTADSLPAHRYPAVLLVVTAAAMLVLCGRNLGKRNWLEL